MNNWWSGLSLKYKLQIPIQLLLLVVMLLVQRAIMDRFEERVLEESRQKTVIAADGVLNGLNMLMINGIISNAEQRALFVKKMGASEKVLELRVIRNKPVQDQYGIGLPSEQPIDEMDRDTLKSAKRQSKLLNQNDVQSLRVIVPFIAKKSFRGTNCLECHNVTEGTVNGAVSITLDVSGEFSEVRHANMIMWGAQAATQIFLYFVIGWLISFVTRPLQRAVATANAVARGDLTQNIEVASKDETGQLLQALKDMNGSLVGIVEEVRSNTDSIATASQEIAQGNADLSSRTEEQASSLEETASSMEQLTSTVKQNADNARQASQLAATASEAAMRGSEAVANMIGNMDAISNASKKIVDIISVIEGIAFQTNILALNAAVEAARAGEQGRGFAVVAGEVRNLAQRSAAAAKEIKALIGDSADKVTSGSQLLESAVEVISEAVGEVRRVTNLIAEIAVASAEQSAGIDQVNKAITQMEETTQQNAALVEEAAAAAEAMEEQANSLMEAVSIFKLDATGGKTRTAAARPAITHAASTPMEKVTAGVTRPARISGKERKLVTAKEDGDWKEF